MFKTLLGNLRVMQSKGYRVLDFYNSLLFHGYKFVGLGPGAVRNVKQRMLAVRGEIRTKINTALGTH
jgi:hypothetical protein